MKKIFVTGGAGYVGSVLVPKLLEKNYKVTVYDLFLYGDDVLDDHKNLKKIKADIRSIEYIEQSCADHDVFLHLACISNDPSFELDPLLGKSINLDSFEPIVKVAIKNKIPHFVFASSSSVYGLKSEKNVTEDISLEPLTDYSKFKAECENILMKYNSRNFITTIIRPATVCGYGKRQRLDVVVNILTTLAYYKNEISVFKNKKINTKNTHGTGCTLSSAITAYFACGKTLKKSCEMAIKYVNEAIASRPNYGKGHGPINHLNSIEIKRKFL